MIVKKLTLYINSNRSFWRRLCFLNRRWATSKFLTRSTCWDLNLRFPCSSSLWKCMSLLSKLCSKLDSHIDPKPSCPSAMVMSHSLLATLDAVPLVFVQSNNHLVLGHPITMLHLQEPNHEWKLRFLLELSLLQLTWRMSHLSAMTCYPMAISFLLMSSA